MRIAFTTKTHASFTQKNVNSIRKS